MRSSYSRFLVVAAAVVMLTGCTSPGGGNYNRLSARNWWPWGKEKQAEGLASQPLPQRPSASATPGGTALSGGNSSYSSVSRGAPTSYPTTSTPHASEGYAGDASGYGAQPASYGAASSYGTASYGATPPASGYEATGAYGAGSGAAAGGGYRTASQGASAGYGAGASSGRYEPGPAAGSTPYESEPVDYSRYESRPSTTDRTPTDRGQPSPGYASGSAGGYDSPAAGGSYSSSSNYSGETDYQPGNTGYDAGNTGYAPAGVSPYESPAPAYDAYNSRAAAPTAGAGAGPSASPGRATTGASGGQYRPGGTRDYSAAGGNYGASAGEATPEMLTPPPASARGYNVPSSGGYNTYNR